jgi:two-component system, OmpR family, response regulator
MPNMARRIAVIEDEPALRDNLRDALARQGYDIQTFAGRPEAQSVLVNRLPELAIIDVGLGDEPEGGFELCRWLRNLDSRLPILILSARDSEIDMVSGLRLGADDYVAKSVSLPHLMARVTALLRRADLAGQASPVEEKIVRGPLTLNLQRFEAHWRDHLMDLTVTEFWLLHSLAKFPGHVKNRDSLMREANMLVDDHTITSYVKRMRRKFEAVDPEFKSIETVYGIGYRFVEH